MNILITGGASGLGEAITRKLVQDSECKVYFTYSKSHINALKIETEFPNAFSIKCDYTNATEVDELKEKIDRLNIDILINNAYNGGFIQSYFHKTAPIDFLNDFKANILPTIFITQSAISCFRKKKNGKIITILTAALINTPPIGSSVYSANKAYMEELTKVWATENVKFNISSNSVSPSFMPTGLTADVDERIVEQMQENHPLKKLLTTEEVADTVFFLTKASPQINGINIVLNAATNIK